MHVDVCLRDNNLWFIHESYNKSEFKLGGGDFQTQHWILFHFKSTSEKMATFSPKTKIGLFMYAAVRN